VGNREETVIWNALFTNGALLYGNDDDIPPSGPSVIAVWDMVDGNPVNGSVLIDDYLAIRPLGNNPDGTATYDLLYHYVLGHARRNLETGHEYPVSDSPFDLEIRHQQITEGTWQGWGWRAEMHGDAGTRDPGVRAIGIYSDAECTQYLYTTGAFVQGTSAWQVDDVGTPLTVWYTECPLGQLRPSRGDWYIAVLYAALQEGHQTLPESQDAIRYLFWEHEQGYVPPAGATWVDTGLTIIQQAGQVYRLSGIPADLSVGQALRLGDTAETTFAGYWPTFGTPSDYIQISPFVQVAIGSVVWKWA
jgi:hypothetical protein